ncbi:MAG TPA: CheR family methyltransferase [Thermoanaerobaculia bacterium]|nr:CheR family methyltransferase [Thermoanaerobaculia bacterium]
MARAGDARRFEDGARRGGPDLPLLVAIGCAAEDLAPLRTLLAGLPAATGIAFVVLLRPEGSAENPREALEAAAKVPLSEASAGERPAPDRIYLAPAGTLLTMADGRFRVERPDDPCRLQGVFDLFCHSMAAECAERCGCIVLDATAAQGNGGLRAVRENGGLALAAGNAAGSYFGTSSDLPGTVLADIVMAVDQMPARLVQHAEYLEHHAAKAAPAADESLLRRAVELLRQRTGRDFTGYKASTLARRLQRRLQVLRLDSAEEYLDHLREDPGEPGLLFQEILISVTGFFRDPQAFEVLAEKVVPQLVERAAQAEAPLRLWVPGCATGEEAYSLAILVRREMLEREVELEVQVFATDLDEAALGVARSGLYPASIAADVPPDLLERFFEAENHGYRLAKRVRQMCIFSRHDLIQDPPFSRLDLISCRNLLIYFGGELQSRVIPLLHYALKPGGILFLGPSEGLRTTGELFVPVSKTHRIFRAREAAPRSPLDLPFLRHRRLSRRSGDGGDGSTLGAPRDAAALAEQMLVAEYAPPYVLIDGSDHVVHFSGKTGRFLEPAAGRPTMSLPALVREGLRTPLRAALQETRDRGGVVRREAIRFPVGGHQERVDLTVRPVPGLRPDSGILMVVFQSTPIEHEELFEVSHTEPAHEVLRELERELRSTREDLEATVEELETANEELRLSNEELLSMNEELQSSNEEMQTSKEELQSVNEELETVNAELATKLEELSHANSDLKNLFETTRIATLFLDERLRVKSFTPPARELFRLIHGDLGRPITDLASRLAYPDLPVDVERVMRAGESLERHIRTDSGAWYIARVLPYRSLEGEVSGVVLTFVDVSDLKHAQDEVSSRARQQEAVAHLGQSALTRASLEEVVEEAVATVAETLGVPLVEVLELRADAGELVLWAGRGWPDERLGRAWCRADAGGQAAYTLASAEPVIVEDLAEEDRFDEGCPLRDAGATSGMTVLIPGRDGAWGVFGAHDRRPRRFSRDDVVFLQAVANVVTASTERQRMEEELARSQREVALRATRERLRRAERLASLGTLAAGIAHEINNPANSILMTAEAARMSGPPPELDQALTVIIEESERCGRIVNKVLDFARARPMEQAVEDLNEVVEQAAVIARKYLKGGRAQIGLRLAPDLPPVRMNVTEMEQVLINLFQNAVDAARSDEVEVTVATAPAEDGRVRLTVTDSGTGMGPDVARQVFDPFFSTRRERGGTGLGLSLVHSIVEEHGGTIDLESEEGRGATFVIELPAAERRDS